MSDFGIQGFRNWLNQFFYKNGQQLITGEIGNAAFQNLLDTLLGVIQTQFGQVGPMISDSATSLKGGVPVAGNTLGKLYNLILTLENTDFKDSYAAMTGTAYNSNMLIVVKNAADGPDVETGAALYFYNNTTDTFEFLAGYDAINFEAEPAGANGEIQFNNAGAAGADANLKWDAVLGLLLGSTKPLSLLDGAIQLVPAIVETVNILRILIDDVEVGKLTKGALEVYGGEAVAAPRLQHPDTDNEPVFTTSADSTTGLGFIYNVTEGKWIPAFYVGGVKTFEIHASYLLLPDGTRLNADGNVVELYPSDNKVKALSIGKNANRFNTLSILVGDAEDGDAGIIIDFRGISYSSDLSALNLLNDNWLTSKKYVDDLAATKVEKVAGKGLSSQDYTLDEKTKLASLNQLFLGSYLTLPALQAAHPTAVPGQSADVDPGPGQPVKKYNWDAQDGWVIGAGGGTIASTDQLPEGAANKYYTDARALALLLGDLTGLIVNGAIANTDSLKAALGKLQGQINQKQNKTDFSQDFYFLAISPDFGVITKDQNFKVDSKAEYSGTVAIKTSADVDYVLGTQVNAGDYLKIYGSVVGVRATLKGGLV